MYYFFDILDGINLIFAFYQFVSVPCTQVTKLASCYVLRRGMYEWDEGGVKGEEKGIVERTTHRSGYLTPGYCNRTATSSFFKFRAGLHLCSRLATLAACMMPGPGIRSTWSASSPFHILGCRNFRFTSTGRSSCTRLRRLRASRLSSQFSSPLLSESESSEK